MTRNVLSWFGRSEERDTLNMSKAHIDQVCKTVESLQKAIHEFHRLNDDGEQEKVEEYVEEVRVREQEADAIKRKILDELSKGLIMPTDREDLTELTERIDDVGDWANDAAKLLFYVTEKVPKKITSKLVKFIDQTIKCVCKTQEAVNCIIEKDVKRTLAMASKVEDIEGQCDILEKETLITTLRYKNLEAGTIILLHDLIGSIETISDKAEEVADVLRVLAIKYK